MSVSPTYYLDTRRCCPFAVCAGALQIRSAGVRTFDRILIRQTRTVPWAGLIRFHGAHLHSAPSTRAYFSHAHPWGPLVTCAAAPAAPCVRMDGRTARPRPPRTRTLPHHCAPLIPLDTLLSLSAWAGLESRPPARCSPLSRPIPRRLGRAPSLTVPLRNSFNIKHLDATYVWNICNIQIKHL
jgi:hypothetical protein